MKNGISKWFIRNLIEKRRIIDNSGYILGKGKIDYLRFILLPENIFIHLEKIFSKKEKILYSIGKKFGYNYVFFQGFPTVSSKKISLFRIYAYFLVRTVEAVYANKLDHQLDYESRKFILKMQNYIICSKNGLGYIFSTGGVAGIWAYACEDKTIEAIQPKCQGRGDKECLVIAAPYETLVKMGYNPVKCTEIEEIKLTQEYKEFNSPKPCKWARNSLKSLIDAGFIKYSHGQVTFKGERFFLCEASFMYILEKELGKIKNGLKILWEVSFDFGKKLAELAGKQEPEDFIMDFFPALGFGDILVLRKKDEYEIIVNNFPWLQDWEKIDFTMFRGILSGVISGLIKKQVELKKIEKYISSGTFTLHITT